MKMDFPEPDFSEISSLFPLIALNFIDAKFPIVRMGLEIDKNSTRTKKKKGKKKKETEQNEVSEESMENEEEENSEMAEFAKLDLKKMKQSMFEMFTLDKFFEVMKKELEEGYLTIYNVQSDVFPGVRGVYVEMEKTNLGCGFYEIEIKLGKLGVSQNDLRRDDKDMNRNFFAKFWIGYDAEEMNYFLIETEEKFNEKYEVVENAIRTQGNTDLFYFCKKTYKYIGSDEHLKAFDLFEIPKQDLQTGKVFENVELFTSDVENHYDCYIRYLELLFYTEQVSSVEYDELLAFTKNKKEKFVETVREFVKEIDKEDANQVDKMNEFNAKIKQWRAVFFEPKIYVLKKKKYVGLNFFALWEFLQKSNKKHYISATMLYERMNEVLTEVLDKKDDKESFQFDIEKPRKKKLS